MKSLFELFTGLFVIAASLYMGGCNYRNVDTIKKNAPKTWEASGFDIIGYEGYQIGIVGAAPGGRVWYIVERKGDPSIRYHGFITKWRDEYHIYSLTSLDALGGTSH